MARRAWRSPSPIVDRHRVDFVFRSQGYPSAWGKLPAHALLCRRDQEGSLVFDPAQGALSAYLFSKESGVRQIRHLKRIGLLTGAQARFASRVLERSTLPQKSGHHTVRNFFAECRRAVALTGDKTLSHGICATADGRLVPVDTLVIRGALVA
jgi:hypothetical protein